MRGNDRRVRCTERDSRIANAVIAAHHDDRPSLGSRPGAVLRSTDRHRESLEHRRACRGDMQPRAFRERVPCGMLGVNLGVPAPPAFFSFGGWKGSLFGDLHAHGPDAVAFCTRRKVVTERWYGAERPIEGWA